MARKPSKSETAGGAAKPGTPRAKKSPPGVHERGASGGGSAPSNQPPTSRQVPVPSARPATRPTRKSGFLHATGSIAPLAQIERLRTFRPPQRVGDSIAGEVERFARELAKHEHAAGGLARAWASLAPAALQQVTRVDRLHAGVLTVLASDASAKYDAEMWLAESGLTALRGAAARTLRRVKVTIG